MKPQLKPRSIFKFNAAGVFAMLPVAALALSATCVSAAPVRAQASPVALQCQVSANSTGYSLACNGTLPGVSGVLHCQSPNVISDNNGVITASQVSCTGTGMLAGITVPGTLTAAALVIDTNNGTITITPGAGTLTVNQGLSTLTATCQGASLSASLSPPVVDVPDGVCSMTLNVLGVGSALLTMRTGSISLANSSILTVNSPGTTLTTSLLGIPVTTITCGAALPISLSQLPSISDLLTLCKGT